MIKHNAESSYDSPYNQIKVHDMGFKFEPEKKKETLNKTIRFPKELVERIEKEVAENDSYFSTFVIQACEYALNESEHPYEKDQPEEDKTEQPV